MTTIADSIKGTLDAGWTAAGGAEPTYFVTEDYTYLNMPPMGTDYIWVIAKSLRTTPKAVNDTYSNITHTIEVRANSPTSADRLKEIADEIVRVLDSTAITGVQWQKCTSRSIITPEGSKNHQESITVTMIELLASSTSAYGANTAASYLNALLMYGSANAAWVPCPFEGAYVYSYAGIRDTGTVYNVGANQPYIYYAVPLPPLKGTLKLYISGTRIELRAATVANYVGATRVYGYSDGTSTQLDADATAKNAPGQWEDTFAAVDCSSYDAVKVQASCPVAVANLLNIDCVMVRCYYAT